MCQCSEVVGLPWSLRTRVMMGCPEVLMFAVCWPHTAIISPTELGSAEVYPCVLSVRGICWAGFWGKWEQWAVGSDGWSQDNCRLVAPAYLQLHRVSMIQQPLGFLVRAPFYFWEHWILWLTWVSQFIYTICHWLLNQLIHGHMSAHTFLGRINCVTG